MSFPRIACGLSVLVGCVFGGRMASGAVIFATDFNSTSVASNLTNGTILNSGGVTTDDVTVATGVNSAVAIVDRGGGNLAMQFTDNSNAADTTVPRAYSATFGPLSTNGTGNNRLFGSFTYTRLVSTNLPAFVFAASANGQQLISTTDNAIRFSVESDGNVYYVHGGASPASVNSGYTLVTGREYRFNVDSDFSSTGTGAQDTWRLTVTDLNSSTQVVDSGWIATRAANVQVNIISMLGGANQGAMNASPFAQIDNISFSATPVPEPTSMAFLLGATGLILRRMRRA